MTADEKLHRQMKRRADHANKREARDYGPLFAQFAPEHTTETAYRSWRLTKARVAEQTVISPLHDAYEWVQVRHIERWAATLWGGSLAAEVAANLRGTYRGKPDYIVAAWSQIVTGLCSPPNWRMRVEFDPARMNPYNRDGAKTFTEAWTMPTPAITREEFKRLFPPLFLAAHVEPTADDLKMDAILALIGSKS